MNSALLIVPVGVLIVIQLVLQVVAIIQLAKTPSERVSIGGRKWAWALIILLGEIVGAVLWFFLGKTQTPAEATGSLSDDSSKRSAVDSLYGSQQE